MWLGLFIACNLFWLLIASILYRGLRRWKTASDNYKNANEINARSIRLQQEDINRLNMENMTLTRRINELRIQQGHPTL